MDATRHQVPATALFTALLCALLLLARVDHSIAQGQSPRRVIPNPGTRPASRPAGRQARQPAGKSKTQQRLPRSRLQTPGLRVQKLEPKLKAVLIKWELASSRIKTLTGEIYRYHREFVFNTEKRGRGQFYYEAPDKGRLDIFAVQIPKGTQSSVQRPSRRDPRNGKVTPARKISLAVSGDNPEKWICDGTQVLEVNDVDRTVTSHRIPADYRGKRIMDGPLPFLFGMPPDKAIRRYHMSLLGESRGEVWIRAFPRWKQDAVNFREATVILDTATYLPKHVRLTAPDNTQTIYSFFRLKVNSKLEAFAKAFGSSPFRPNLSRYRVVASQSDPLVPSVIGMPWKKAQSVLTAAGYKVKFSAGVAASKRDLTYVIYQQAPRQQAALAPGSQIQLTFFAKPIATGSKKR